MLSLRCSSLSCMVFQGRHQAGKLSAVWFTVAEAPAHPHESPAQLGVGDYVPPHVRELELLFIAFDVLYIGGWLSGQALVSGWVRAWISGLSQFCAPLPNTRAHQHQRLRCHHHPQATPPMTLGARSTRCRPTPRAWSSRSLCAGGRRCCAGRCDPHQRQAVSPGSWGRQAGNAANGSV